MCVTVKELKEWLNRFPEDTEVLFAQQQESPMYQSYGEVKFITPVLDTSDGLDGWSYDDFRNNKFVQKDKDYYGKAFLNIGESF